MASKEEFQEKMCRLGELISDLDAVEDDHSNEPSRELIRLLMEIHGTALQRMLEILDESGAPGQAMILKAGQDPLVRSILVLYSLHPESLETRVLKALEVSRSQLRKLNSDVELVSTGDGAATVRILISGHACGSTGKTARSIVEESLNEYAPDLTALEILDAEDEPASGFVSIDSLLQHSVPAREVATHEMQVASAD